MTGPAGRTTVHADLRLEIDGRPVSVTADGDEITVRTDDAGAAAAAVSTVVLPGGARRVMSRRAVARVGDTLADRGLTVRVVGPRGEVATLGEKASSGRVARVLLGTGRVRLGRWDVVRDAARPTVLAAVRGAPHALLGALRRRLRR